MMATTNEEIVLKLGWKYDKGSKRWISPSRKYPLLRNPHDYEHDWAHAGPLLEELPDDIRIEIRLATWPDKGKFACTLIRGQRLLSIDYGDTRKAAACRAWLKLKKEEEDHE